MKIQIPDFSMPNSNKSIDFKSRDNSFMDTFKRTLENQSSKKSFDNRNRETIKSSNKNLNTIKNEVSKDLPKEITNEKDSIKELLLDLDSLEDLTEIEIEKILEFIDLLEEDLLYLENMMNLLVGLLEENDFLAEKLEIEELLIDFEEISKNIELITDKEISNLKELLNKDLQNFKDIIKSLDLTEEDIKKNLEKLINAKDLTEDLKEKISDKLESKPEIKEIILDNFKKVELENTNLKDYKSKIKSKKNLAKEDIKTLEKSADSLEALKSKDLNLNELRTLNLLESTDLMDNLDPINSRFDMDKGLSINSFFEKTNAETILQSNINNIVSEIVEKFSITKVGDLTEIKMQLVPNELGRVVIKLSTDENIVNARIHAESGKAKEFLETNLESLKDALGEKGISIGSIDVFVGDESNAFSFDENRYYLSKNIKEKELSYEEIEKLLKEEMDKNPYIEKYKYNKLI